MNWANRLTIARFFITLIFVAALSSEWPFSRTVALALFIVAGITDYVDGEIARRYSQVTNFGKLMDPLVDKIMMAAGFICLVPLHAMPAWVAVIIVSREFLITGLRLLAGARGKVLASEGMGKHKTTWQIVTILFFLLLLAIHEWHEAHVSWWQPMWHYGGTLLVTIAVTLTLFSGANYIWKHRAVLAE
ncbi:MAG: CDP-diacylglycerol--glycerol-3-phosphate 3-phosphatidyltransferase [Verrucomicrobiota bacterium]|nr:CDP-diacylglycerol--glycerol-3-phosphate 3-phosphatidyltransferase [Verrucomicrobiota bacterium]